MGCEEWEGPKAQSNHSNPNNNIIIKIMNLFLWNKQNQNKLKEKDCGKRGRYCASLICIQNKFFFIKIFKVANQIVTLAILIINKKTNPLSSLIYRKKQKKEKKLSSFTNSSFISFPIKIFLKHNFHPPNLFALSRFALSFSPFLSLYENKIKVATVIKIESQYLFKHELKNEKEKWINTSADNRMYNSDGGGGGMLSGDEWHRQEYVFALRRNKKMRCVTVVTCLWCMEFASWVIDCTVWLVGSGNYVVV